MTDYLSYKFNDTENFVSTFDEAPLWSASFGLLLLKHLELKPNLTVIDIGSGTGFPLMELAGRLGPSCKLYGVDHWKNAFDRAGLKIKNYGYANVEIINGSAATLPFKDNSIDLVVSNLGINNFENPDAVFKECHRVLKSSGQLALTTNSLGHWKEFYEIFYTTLGQLGMENYAAVVLEEEKHRGTLETISGLFTNNNFRVSRHYHEHSEMNFLNGTAFLNHHFIKLGWLGGWMKLFPADEHQRIFSLLEQNLNNKAANDGSLRLTVPMIFIEGMKNK